MKKGICFICALFVMLTGFNQQERVVEQGNTDLPGRASVAGEKPEIHQHLMQSLVNEGGIITFLAELAQPTDSKNVTWFKNDKPVVVDARVKTYVDKTTVTLVINKVKKDDAGVYKVVVKNAYGEARSSAKLTVIEK